MFFKFLIPLMISGILVCPISADSTSHPTTTIDIRSKFNNLLKEIPSTHFYPAKIMGQLLEKYDEDELGLIYQDLIEIREKTFANVSKKLDYVVTAGGPTTGKSTLLEDLLKKKIVHRAFDPDIVRAYIDPDRSCLFDMKNTYLRDLSTGKRDSQRAYEHWRDASNFLSNYYLAIALKEGYAIAHGSTMATPHSKHALKAIHNVYGYSIIIVHLTCDEKIREESEHNRRERGVYQCTDIDFQKKPAMFFSLLPVYIECADKLLFYYRPSMNTFIEAAKIEKDNLEIEDKSMFCKICELHDAAQGIPFCENVFANFSPNR